MFKTYCYSFAFQLHKIGTGLSPAIFFSNIPLLISFINCFLECLSSLPPPVSGFSGCPIIQVYMSNMNWFFQPSQSQHKSQTSSPGFVITEVGLVNYISLAGFSLLGFSISLESCREISAKGQSVYLEQIQNRKDDKIRACCFPPVHPIACVSAEYHLSRYCLHKYIKLHLGLAELEGRVCIMCNFYHLHLKIISGILKNCIKC